jgi:hypothetical protein
MWAEMKPDMYGGETCDQIRPRWRCYALGDKDSDYTAILTLDARTFPPGTKVIISEPVCPQCDEVRSPQYPIPDHGAIFEGPCRCGFDWDGWVAGEYS